MERSVEDGSRFQNSALIRHLKGTGNFLGRTALVGSFLVFSQTDVGPTDNPNSTGVLDAQSCDTSGLSPTPELICSFLNNQGRDLTPNGDTATTDVGQVLETSSPTAVVSPTSIPTQASDPPPQTQAGSGPNFRFILNVDHAQSLDDSQKKEFSKLMQNGQDYFTNVLHDGPSNDIIFQVITDASSPIGVVANSHGINKVQVWPNNPSWQTIGDHGLPGEAYRQSAFIHEPRHITIGEAYRQGLTIGSENQVYYTSLNEGWATLDGLEGAAIMLGLDPAIPRRCALLQIKASRDLDLGFVTDVKNTAVFSGNQSILAYNLAYIGVATLREKAAQLIATQGGWSASMYAVFRDTPAKGPEASQIKHLGIDTSTLSHMVDQAAASSSGTCP